MFIIFGYENIKKTFHINRRNATNDSSTTWQREARREIGFVVYGNDFESLFVLPLLGETLQPLDHPPGLLRGLQPVH